MLARRLVPRLRKILVAASAAPALRHQHALARNGKVRESFAAGIIESYGADGYLQNQIFAAVPRAIRAFAVPAPIRLELAIVAVAQQRVVVRIRFEINAAAVPAGGPAARDVLLPPERHAAIPAVPGLHKNLRFINKHELNSPCTAALSWPELRRQRVPLLLPA